MNNYDTIVLSGGSIKGFIILGALQYLYDNNLHHSIKTYIGTSIGSMISYFLCIGYTPLEIVIYICGHQLLEKLQNFNISDMLQGNGAASFSNIHDSLEKMTLSKIGYLPTLSNIKDRFGKTLIFTTYNISQDKIEYLSHETYPDLPCLSAIRMSSNLPMIFGDYRYGGSYYIDGGLGNNFPIDIGDKYGEKILGLTLDDKTTDFMDIKYNFLEYVYKLMSIPVCQLINNKIENASKNNKCKILRLKYGKINILNFNISPKQKLEMFSDGYNQIKEFLENTDKSQTTII